MWTKYERLREGRAGERAKESERERKSEKLLSVQRIFSLKSNEKGGDVIWYLQFRLIINIALFWYTLTIKD